MRQDPAERERFAWQRGTPWRLAAALGVALIAACNVVAHGPSPRPDGDRAGDPDGDRDRDDALRRAEWMKAYFGSAPTPEYLEFKRQAATATATRWVETLSTAVS